MNAPLVINVILPLKLGWEPFYIMEGCDTVKVGDRVSAPFAGRYYLGVVSAVGTQLPENIKAESVKKILGVYTDKTPLLPSEIEYFRRIAEYYMCSVGEVYKAAYPMTKDESVRRRKSKDDVAKEGTMKVALEAAEMETYDGLARMTGKPVLCEIGGHDRLLQKLALDHSATGNVLWLVPEMKLGKSMEEELRGIFGDRLVIWGSTLTPARKREAARRVRCEEPYILLGTRSSLFLPHHNLSLIIVQDEHDASYKQSSPAPRYNGRDAALILGSLHNAQVVLESSTPSLESIYNCLTGKYLHAGLVTSTDTGHCGVRGWTTEIVDTRAELRKMGMVGDISRRLIAEAQGCKCAVYKPRRAMFPKMEELMPQVSSTLGGSCFVSDDLIERPLPSDTEVLAVLGVDSMLGRADFRADEKAFQAIHEAVGMCSESLRKVVIQTREASHPVFAALANGSMTPLLEERREFGFPPFSRMIDICLQDSFPDRASRMSAALAARINSLGICTLVPGPSGLRLMLEKGRHLTSRKITLMSVMSDFERENKYSGHIYFDVDPL